MANPLQTTGGKVAAAVAAVALIAAGTVALVTNSSGNPQLNMGAGTITQVACSGSKLVWQPNPTVKTAGQLQCKDGGGSTTTTTPPTTGTTSTTSAPTTTTSTTTPPPSTCSLDAAGENCFALTTGVVGYAEQVGTNYDPGVSYSKKLQDAYAGQDPNLGSTLDCNVVVLDSGAVCDGTNNVIAGTAPSSNVITLAHHRVNGCVAVKTVNNSAHLIDLLVSTTTECQGGHSSANLNDNRIGVGGAHAAISTGSNNSGYTPARHLVSEYVTVDMSNGSPKGTEGPGVAVDNGGYNGQGFVVSHGDIFGAAKAFFTLTSPDPTQILDTYMHDTNVTAMSAPTCNHEDPIFVWSTNDLTVDHVYIHAQTPAGVAAQGANQAPCAARGLSQGISGAIFFQGPTGFNERFQNSYVRGDTGFAMQGPTNSPNMAGENFLNLALDPHAKPGIYSMAHPQSWANVFNSDTHAQLPSP